MAYLVSVSPSSSYQTEIKQAPGFSMLQDLWHSIGYLFRPKPGSYLPNLDRPKPLLRPQSCSSIPRLSFSSPIPDYDVSLSTPCTPTTSTPPTLSTSRYRYKLCPMEGCSERLLVYIDDVYVYKWVNAHFHASHPHQIRVVVNLVKE
ncbi:hypothetical protein BZG36_01316 [Bifiguratus adelaidae]|uniref:Uncharacterized protein n=1 Tax=Bifiguratus adelaidae TaxID=1938954 RepID=A0A261Y5I7_9FUNG|nr:hypothetical protein BZG36_01316 [Bifiguratus adelaidae]